MAIKPNTSTILETYTLEELLSLVKEKAHKNAEETIAGIREKFRDISLNIGIEQPVSKPGKKRGRPKTKASVVQKKAVKEKPVSKPKTQKRSKNKVSLRECIIAVLDKNPMKIDEIFAAIKKQGWKSSSSTPKRLIQLELGKLIKNNTIAKAERGMYSAK